MGVSKNKGTPKWMVKIMENPTKMDDLGTIIIGNAHIMSFLLVRGTFEYFSILTPWNLGS